VKGSLVIENYRTGNESTNELLSNSKLNTTVIKDNSLDKAPVTKYSKTGLYTPTTIINSSTIILNVTGYREDMNNSYDASLAKTLISTTKPTPTHNSTTTIPPHPKGHHSHKYEILQYVLIPLGCVLFIIAALCVVSYQLGWVNIILGYSKMYTIIS
jgi:hypothetical protein